MTVPGIHRRIAKRPLHIQHEQEDAGLELQEFLVPGQMFKEVFGADLPLLNAELLNQQRNSNITDSELGF